MKKCFLAILLFASPAHAVDFETLVGSDLPSPNSPDIKRYLKNSVVAARVAECEDAVRTVTYYVDSDSTTGGTGLTTATSGAARALDTIADVNTVIAASSGYINILFRTGKEWSTSEDLLIDGKDGVHIGTYTTDDVYTPPIIHCFTQSASGSWTSNSDSGSTSDGVATYYRTLASEPGWMIESTTDFTKLDPLRFRDTLAECQATARSWTWIDADDRLYIHYSADPASIAFKYSLESDADDDGGIVVNNADLTLIEGIRLEGFGCTAFRDNITYGIRLLASIDRCVIRDCQSYYNGNHCFGSTGGGQVIFQRCQGGYCNYSTGSTTFVFYDTVFDATDECIFDECSCIAGHLLNDSISSSLNSLSGGFYAHKGSSGTCGLIAAIDCREPGPMAGTNATATYGTTSFDDVPGDDTLSSIRAFWISHRNDRDSRQYHISKSKNAFLGCLWRCVFPTGGSSDSWRTGSSTGGWFLNCIFDFTDYTSSVQRSMFYSTDPTFVNCSFHFNGNNASKWVLYELGSATPYFQDCVIARNGTRQVVCGTGATTDYGSDTYFGTTAVFYVNQSADYNGFGNVNGQVRLTKPLRAFQSPLGTVAETGQSSSGPEWDYYWRRRPTSGGSLGAIEANPIDDYDVQTQLEDITTNGVKLRRVD